MTGSVGSSPPAYDVGERVGVLYHADVPEQARIEGFIENGFAPSLFGGLGGIFALIGFGYGGLWRL